MMAAYHTLRSVNKDQSKRGSDGDGERQPNAKQPPRIVGILVPRREGQGRGVGEQHQDERGLEQEIDHDLNLDGVALDDPQCLRAGEHAKRNEDDRAGGRVVERRFSTRA